MLMDVVSRLNLEVVAVNKEEWFTNKLVSTKWKRIFDSSWEKQRDAMYKISTNEILVDKFTVIFWIRS
jgi:hypothetical protein